jgi:branched-chain amino acid transport system permease protein
MAVITGSLVERLVLRPLLSQSILTIIMATLALSCILRGLMLIFWTGYSLSFPEPLLPRKPFIVMNIVMPQEMMWGFIIAMIAFIVLAYFFLKTRTGLRMRSVSEDHELSMACGVNITRIFALTWIFAAVLGTLGGVLLGNRIGLSAVLTPPIALKAFPAVLFGGVESISGAILGGLITGIIENLVGGLIDPSLGEISPYVILLLVLILRPTGLFGLKRVERI